MAAVVTVSIPGTQGVPGPPNKLTIGTVTTGAPGTNASATITGIAPNQVLSLTIPGPPESATWGKANTLALRDANGATGFAGVDITNQPFGPGDATRKDYVDALGTAAATPDTVVRRNSSGNASFGRVFLNTTPHASVDEAVRKDYVDGQIATRIASFADPNADRIVFWDDSVSAYAALTASTGLTISGTNMTVRTANETQTGIVELATAAETTTGTDNTRAVHPQGLKVELDKKVTGVGILKAEKITQAAYDALVTAGTTVATTLYVIQD